MIDIVPEKKSLNRDHVKPRGTKTTDEGQFVEVACIGAVYVFNNAETHITSIELPQDIGGEGVKGLLAFLEQKRTDPMAKFGRIDLTERTHTKTVFDISGMPMTNMVELLKEFDQKNR